MESIKQKKLVKPKKITLDHILNFVFPAYKKHPRTGLRFWLIGEQVENIVEDENNLIHLSSTRWYQPRHQNPEMRVVKMHTIMQNYEVEVMLDEVRDRFLKEIFHLSETHLTQREISVEILSRLPHKLLKNVFTYRKIELEHDFREAQKKVTKDSKESENEYLARVIAQCRWKRLHEMRQGQPNIRNFRHISLFEEKNLLVARRSRSKTQWNFLKHYVHSISTFQGKESKLHRDMFKLSVVGSQSKIPISVMGMNCTLIKDADDPSKDVGKGWVNY